jgi:Fungal specific transcription factor domain
MRTTVPVPVPVPVSVPVSEPEPLSPVNSSRTSPAPSQTDLQNHYVGPSSGVSFLLRVQKRLHKVVTLSPRSSIFTFGDTPLPEFDSSFFVLPPKEYARTLIARYFDFAVPTHRFLHRPSLEGYLEELYSHLGVMLDRKGERGKRALLFMVFAQAQEYMPHVSGRDSDCRHDMVCPWPLILANSHSVRYFQAAEHQLRAETGEIRLTSVQARLCQCFYLLSESRINHCWSLFGTTAPLLLALGIHRKLKWENSKHYDMIDVECRKRVFWAAYTLDNYLSAALGRPRTFHDEDIDQEMPSLVSDEEITSSRIITTPSKSQSIMLAPVYHAR